MHIRYHSRFLGDLRLKTNIHLVNIIIFSQYHVIVTIVRPTKIISRADKNWAHLKKIDIKVSKKHTLIYFHLIALHMWFHAQLAQKILNGI